MAAIKSAPKQSDSAVSIVIPKLGIKRLRVKLIGDSPLVVHAWSDKAREMMLAKQMKKATQGKQAKDPFQDYCDSLYWLSPRPEKPTQKDIDKAKFGFPSIGFKAAAVTACTSLDVTKVEARQAFHVVGDMVEINGSPKMHESMVRVGMGVSDIRFRGMFEKWSVVLDVRYNERAMSASEIVNLFNTAGFGVGVGEWRPERDGSWGMFHVAEDGE